MITKEQLKEMRVSAGMTQQDLATKMKSTQQVVGNYETGVRSAGFNILKKWATACGFTVEINLIKNV